MKNSFDFYWHGKKLLNKAEVIDELTMAHEDLWPPKPSFPLYLE